jgi:hypothetical protein
MIDELDKWTSVHPLAAVPRPHLQRMSSEDVKPRVEKRMARIDSLTPEQRMVIHEYGWNLVDTFLNHGVTSPRAMRALINAIRELAVDRVDRAATLPRKD